MTRETRTAVSVSDSRAGNGVTRETSEDLNEVKILERERGENRPASGSTREQGDANGSERLRQSSVSNVGGES
ncbi:hypothetical protein [Halapricum desulfuricans]|uniref:hypothetical protein n=1 Tax=Halapricum desulfuricans TaxID=2841257 RepID=UPI001E4DCF42|nr:hypothetical protein [Halapricum desulfuricans]